MEILSEGIIPSFHIKARVPRAIVAPAIAKERRSLVIAIKPTGFHCKI